MKLDKGDYVIRCQIRHEKTDYLEKVSDIPILIQQKLGTPINVDLYASYCNAIVGIKKAYAFSTFHSVQLKFYVAPIPSDKYVSEI